MIADRLLTFLFPKQGLCDDTMYYHVQDGNAATQGDSLFLPQGTLLSLDGYFNVLDTAPYRDYTAISSITYRLTLKGSLRLSLYLSCPAKCKKGYEDVLLRELSFSSPDRQELSFSLPLPEQTGTMWLALRSESDAAFYGGSISADTEPLRSVKIGIAITTFHREEFVKRNVAAIKRDLPSDQFGVFIVDNGGTLTPADLPGAFLFPNKNLGGSGGFTRGMMEVLKKQEFTHILLADDDVCFESEIFLRTAAILRYASCPDKIIVGGSMLFSDKPWCQMEMGAKWTGRKLVPHLNGADLRLRASLVKNASHPAADYSGWWYNCFSVSLPKEIGLPLPFFIKIDDVEYCLRARASILLLNGIGVWHEDFDYKFSSALDYYHERNKLILNALHRKKRGAIYHFFSLMRAAIKQIVLYRYHSLDLVFEAYKDFLAGADCFLSTDAEALHKTLAERGERQLSREELQAMGYDLSRPFFRSEPFEIASFKQVVTMNGYLLPAKKEDYRIVNLTENNPNDFYRAKRVLQYNPITQTGFFSERRLLVLIKTSFRLLGYFFRLLFRFRKASRSFRERFPNAVSAESWKERLGLPD